MNIYVHFFDSKAVKTGNKDVYGNDLIKLDPDQRTEKEILSQLINYDKQRVSTKDASSENKS